jgi:hypothetical protein
MTDGTYFVALPFVAADDGVAAGEPTECFNPVAVVMRAEALSRKPGHVGAVAFSRTGDPATGHSATARTVKGQPQEPQHSAVGGGTRDRLPAASGSIKLSVYLLHEKADADTPWVTRTVPLNVHGSC